MHQALTMPQDQRIARWGRLMEVVSRSTIKAWRESFLQALEEVRSAERATVSRPRPAFHPRTDQANQGTGQ